MGDFSADWLALRAPADARARSQELIERTLAWLSATRDADAPLTIADLGAGSGATVRALAPVLHEAGYTAQHWLLLDADADLLAHAANALSTLVPGLRVTPVQLDLAATPTGWPTRPDLVTCSAFFDLVSQNWVDRFCATLAGDGHALLAFLTYSGTLTLSPPHAHDAAMVDAFNAHQRTDKGFGAALGPDAAGAVAHALTNAGYDVAQRRSDWALAAPEDARLIAEVLDGWAGAALELQATDGTSPSGDAGLTAQAITAWRAARTDTSAMTVSHLDLLALPR
ncbi:MAG: class I SAM-dependent methyltransferase [Pseudomonadota bacterium]